MKKKLLLFLSIVFLAGLFINVSAQENKGIQFHQNESWESIVALAKKENKLIFMDCYTSWCGPCKALARDVFPQQKVGDFFNPRFINVQYDMEKGDGKMLYNKYKKYIIGFPTLLLIDQDGKVLQQMAGYQEPDKLIEGIKNASAGNDLFSLGERYKKGERDFTFIKAYISSLQGAFLKDSVTAVANDYLSRIELKELDKDDVWEVLGPTIKDVNSPAFNYVVQNADRFTYKLHRDRYRINRQLEGPIHAEVSRLIRLSKNDQGEYLPLVNDKAQEDKMLNFISRASLNKYNETKAKFFIHRLLIDGNYPEAWKYITDCANMGLIGFYSYHLQSYIEYMSTKSNDKKLLKEMLAKLEEYKLTENDKNPQFSYHMYNTMSVINTKLGNKKLAEQQAEKYKELDAQKRKEMEEFFKKD